uniref:WD repeat domain 17 n=1 Tax=Falco tinnunculus TaxID=100819 RepID=A0A8C4TWC0_FALTI
MAWMTYISHWFDEDDWYEGQQRAKMSQVKQVGLLAAGCQPWNKDVCAASGDRFAYCATLAIYIYQLDHQYNEFKLRAIMSEHKKTITAISWCPHNPDTFASASADSLVIIWNVTEQKVVAKLDNTKGIPASLSWCWNADDAVAFVSHRGPLYIWTISGPDSGVTVHREAHSFLSDISLFRWHPKKKGKVVFGHTDGSLSIFQPGSKNQKHVLRPESLEGTDEEDPVTALEWDPLSTDYLLVANLHNGIRLVDSESLSCITNFNFPSAAASVQCLAWVSSAPGMFVTGDSQVGVLRIWNVSRTTPIDNFKLKKTGFHGLHVLSSPPKKKSCSSQYPTKNHHTSSTSEAVPPPTLTQNQAFSLPPGHAVCCFMDGGVGLYDMGAKKWDFLRDLGHVETIFDCKFKPDNPDLLATASFDGTIKVWDINTLTAVYTSPGNEGVIYSLSWAPGDLNCIAGATSRNGAFIWDVLKGKMITRFSEHGKNGIFCIAWSHKDSKRIATCSSDGFCIIRTIDGKVLHKYKHPAAVFGCDWSQNNKDMIATGCEDKNVRVYYLATSSDQPLKVFTGHTAKVFHVRWSPLREGILCSGSDDGCINLRSLVILVLPPGGSKNLWDLVAVIKGQDDSLLPQNYCKGIMHMKHLIRFRMWDKALSVAPGVSMKYWRKLMQRRADQLIQEESDDVIPYCIAVGDVEKLVSFFTSRGQLKEALLVAQAACEGNIQISPLSTTSGSSNSGGNNTDDYNELLHKVSKELAEWYFQDGHAVLAACCHLAVENIELAMANLIRGNELELAISVGTVLGESAAQATHYALELLARKYLAADLLMMIPDNKLQLVKLCAFYPGCAAEISDLHEKCNLPDVEECMRLAETFQADGDIFETIKYYLLSTEPEKALPVGIQYVKEQLCGSDWTLDSVCPYLDLLSYIRTERLVLHKCSEFRNELLILCGYIGALLAIRRQYNSIVPALYEYTSQLLKRREVSVPLKIEQLSEELDAWRACTQLNKPTGELQCTPPSEWQRTVYSVLVSRIQEEPLKGMVGPDYVTGSNLPSHSDVHISCLTGLRIQGPVFFLEDGKSAVSLNDALMWAKVNPFSPLGTGIRLNPF